MRFRQLREVLQCVVLAGLPACTIGPSFHCDPTHDELAIALPSDPPTQLRVESCRVDVDACTELCAYATSTSATVGTVTCKVTFDAEHAYLSIDTQPRCVGGRMPAGLVQMPRDRVASPGAWLARVAWLEAASVPAFVFLARELEGHLAPRELIAAARAAVGDEIRHAALVGGLARRFGGQPAPAQVEAQAARSLEALAIENAVEGCVRETWGAALALRQSLAARDPEVRVAFAAIARDELRHAALGWAIDRWARTRLDDAARARVTLARAAAARALLDEPPDPEMPLLGLPDSREYRALRARVHDALWAGGVA